MTENCKEAVKAYSHGKDFASLACIGENVMRLKEAEKEKQEDKKTNGVFPVKPNTEIYESALREAKSGCFSEWQPDVRSAMRREAKRRRRTDAEYDGERIVSVSVDSIRPNISQPRLHFETNSVIRLADSIKRYGILQPLSVRVISPRRPAEAENVPTTEGMAAEQTDAEKEAYENIRGVGTGTGVRFELIAGERRFRAAKMLGMKNVPCIIVSADDKRSAELSLIENLLREDLDMFETARAIQKLIDAFSMTQDEIAKRLSMSQSAVANKLRLLRYTDDEEKIILENHLTERHARALLRLETPEERLGVIEIILARRMNVSATEAYIEKLIEAAGEKKISASEMKKIPVIKDIRLFYNSLDRAVELVRTAGVNIESKRREDENGVTIEIKIPNPRGTENECFT